MIIDLTHVRHYSGNIAIVPHTNADFDAMVSGILLKHVFTELEIESRVVLQDGIADEFFMPKASELKLEFAVDTGGLRENEVLFLVDHTAAYRNKVIGCFDHHPKQADIPCNYVNKSQTCCAKIIYDWAVAEGVKIPDILTKFVIYACHMDSLSFKSDKALPEDRKWCRKMMDELGMDEQEVIMFGYGLTDLTQDPKTLFNTGVKSYNFNGKKIKASYACTGGSTQADKILANIAADYLRGELNDDVVAWCYIVQNAVSDWTHVTLIQKDGYVQGSADHVVSRGKTIIPEVMKYLNK